MATLTVPEWAGGKLTNGEALNYAKAVATELESIDKTKVNIASQLTALAAVNVKLADAVNESAGYNETHDIAFLDARRDVIFRALWNAIDILSSLDDEGLFATDARNLRTGLSAYKGLDKHSLAQETEEIYGLKTDIEKRDDLKNAATRLGFNPILTELFNVNATVDALYTQRTEARGERAVQKGGDTATSLRKEAMNLVVEIISVVNATNKVAPSDAAAAAAQVLYGIVEQYKNIAAQGKTKKPDPAKASKSTATA